MSNRYDFKTVIKAGRSLTAANAAANAAVVNTAAANAAAVNTSAKPSVKQTKVRFRSKVVVIMYEKSSGDAFAVGVKSIDGKDITFLKRRPKVTNK